MEFKCTQCGCTDLEEVNFPMEVGFNNDGYENVRSNNSYFPTIEHKFVKRDPVLRQTQYDGDGGAVTFELANQYFCTTSICTKCGHFEFFNRKLAESILEERAENARTQCEIDKLNKQISKNDCEIENINKQIDDISIQLEDLDITIRQSNELKEKINALKVKTENLNKATKELMKKKKKLEGEEIIEEEIIEEENEKTNSLDHPFSGVILGKH